MRIMRFKKPVFREGLNFTVRLGEDWKSELSLGDVFCLEGVDDKIGYVQKLYVCKLEDVPQEVFDREHDSRVRDSYLLLTTLLEVYADKLKGIPTEDVRASPVTCIGFYLVDVKEAAELWIAEEEERTTEPEPQETQSENLGSG